MNTPYEAPSITVIGSLHELTLQNAKGRNGADGTLLAQPGGAIPIGETSLP